VVSVLSLKTTMLEVMYEIPSMDRVREVVINEDAIMGVSRPLVLQDCAEIGLNNWTGNFIQPTFPQGLES